MKPMNNAILVRLEEKVEEKSNTLSLAVNDNFTPYATAVVVKSSTEGVEEGDRVLFLERTERRVKPSLIGMEDTATYAFLFAENITMVLD